MNIGASVTLAYALTGCKPRDVVANTDLTKLQVERLSKQGFTSDENVAKLAGFFEMSEEVFLGLGLRSASPLMQLYTEEILDILGKSHPNNPAGIKEAKAALALAQKAVKSVEREPSVLELDFLRD